MEPIQYLWKDRKRHLGLPLSFTRYSLSEDRLFCEKGFLNLKCDEVLLYRVRDLQLNMSLGQRILGVGTICVISSDKSVPHLDSGECEAPTGGKGTDSSEGGGGQGQTPDAHHGNHGGFGGRNVP